MEILMRTLVLKDGTEKDVEVDVFEYYSETLGRYIEYCEHEDVTYTECYMCGEMHHEDNIHYNERDNVEICIGCYESTR